MPRHELQGCRGIAEYLHMLSWILLIEVCLLPLTASKQFFHMANDKEILDFLLHKNNYDKRMKPYSDNPLQVNVSVLLLSLSSPDESSLNYEVDFLLHSRWTDTRLIHDDDMRHSYLSAMHHLDAMWIPDIFFIKHGNFKTPLHPDDVLLRVYRNGTVEYTRRLYLVLSCEGNLDVFPFDDPVCDFFIESSSYEMNEMVLVWQNDSASNNGRRLVHGDTLKELNAYLIYNETKTCERLTSYSWRGNFSCLNVTLVFSRDDSFYFSTVFIPSIILVTSSFITFWLEWNAVPARVMIGVTTMLNFFTTSNSFRSTLPVVSNLAAMNVWDSVCMFFIYVSLLEFVVVNYVGRKRSKHNNIYRPGENAVIQVLSENRHRIPQAIHRLGLSLRDYIAEKKKPGANEATDVSQTEEDADEIGNKNSSHETPSCTNCGNAQCSQSNSQMECPPVEDNIEISQVEYTFNKRRSKDPTHPIRVAKSIDVISRVVFPLSYTVFLLYFFATYMQGFDEPSDQTSNATA